MFQVIRQEYSWFVIIPEIFDGNWLTACCRVVLAFRRTIPSKGRGKRARVNTHNRCSHDYILKGWKKNIPGYFFLRSLYFFPDGHANILPIEKLMI